MNRLALLKITNLVLFLSVAVQAATGLSLLFTGLIIKIGLLGLILDIHKYNGIIFVLLAISHISQNWGWIRMNILKAKGRS